MDFVDRFSIISHIINFLIFIYFIIFLLRANVLDLFGLFISAFGLVISLISNIISVSERYQKP